MMLMDFCDDYLGAQGRALPDDGAAEESDEPTFLYAMHLDDPALASSDNEHWFVEETSLAARPPVSFDLLESRLKRRLHARDVVVHQIHDTERVRIPMGGPMPRLDQPIVGIGGAAAMPHPATGYMVARGWRAAVQLRNHIGDVFQTDGDASESPVMSRARRGWKAVWPTDSVRARRLYNFGLETLLSLDADSTRRFFSAFFELPQSQWQAYLGGDASPATLASVMWQLFRRASPSTKWRIMRASMSSNAIELWRAWRGG
jgi:lycopene cyclase-like protein